MAKQDQRRLTPVSRRKHINPAVLGLFVTLIFMAGSVMLIIEHRDSMNNALDTGECLAGEQFHGLIDFLKHLLRLAYRFIFKACG
ncbi:hypothetical protein [Pantoea sp. JV6]|uniref:hypothetical protein n=1 Tax=Pantoea sp. JV6 TaxID=2981604 RepID=UPI00221F24CF|nr:hypothetical protein [Pantoea sp. JV6]MCW0974168.1 hypothetical protein [Pantoea sp. JV6]